VKVAIDAVGIRDGGGAAILEELLYWLPRVRPDWRWDVFLLDRALRQFGDPPAGPTVTLQSTRRGNTGLGRIFWARSTLPRLLRRRGVDLLFAFANTAPVRPPVPQVVYCHQPLVLFTDAHTEYPLWQRARLRVQRHVVWQGLRVSRAVVVQTAGMRDRLLVEEPRLAGRVEVIPSGYRTPPPAPVVRAEVRAALAAAPQPRLLYVSFLRYHKNHLTLLKAMAIIAKTHPNARLLLTIDPTAAMTADVATLHVELKKQVAELGLANHVTWLGHLTPDEVAESLRASDLMVFPSLAESFGLPLVEAMAAGCPIAAADLPYAHDVAGPTAAYFDPRDPAAVAACILRVLDDPAALAALRREGEDRRTEYSYDTIAERLAALFERTVCQPEAVGR
jgi:glycosyltransferase involved in cell wall biosynthesis